MRALPRTRAAAVQAVALGLCAAVGAAGLAGGCVRRAQTPPAFDAERAFAHLEAQCRLGPRVPGTEAHEACRELLRRELSGRTPHVEVREVRGRDGWGRELVGWNLIATYPGRGAPLVLGAHWDSRARADQDPDPQRRHEPVPGANDGASGVAVLLEFARLLQEAPPPRPVHLAFFDLEDQGTEDAKDRFCLGSRAAARDFGPGLGARAIILDMVGARDMVLLPEVLSVRLAPGLTAEIWRLAAESGSRAFRGGSGPELLDDHVPFLRLGWEAVDVVDTRYPFWHTTQDTPDKCSSASLGEVGNLIRRLVYGLPAGA